MSKNKVKDLKNIKHFEFKQLSFWGIVGAIVLVLWSIVATVLISVIDVKAVDFIWNVVGLTLGFLYLVLGVFGLILVYKKRSGSIWGLFLAASAIAVLAPLAWFSYAGISISIIAGILFLIYYLLES